MRRLGVRGGTLLAVAVAAAVVAISWHPWEQPDDTAAGSFRSLQSGAAAGSGQPVADGNSVVAGYAATILARPLFSASRQPPHEATPLATSDAAPAPPPRLSAVLVGPSDRTAIFVFDDTGKVAIAHEGSTVGPYTVRAIEAGQVQVDGPEGRLTLRPRFNRAPTRHPDDSPALPKRATAEQDATKHGGITPRAMLVATCTELTS